MAGLRLFTEYVAESRDTVIEREAFHGERVVFVDDSVLSGREYVEVQLERRVPQMNRIMEPVARLLRGMCGL